MSVTSSGQDILDTGNQQLCPSDQPRLILQVAAGKLSLPLLLGEKTSPTSSIPVSLKTCVYTHAGFRTCTRFSVPQQGTSNLEDVEGVMFARLRAYLSAIIVCSSNTRREQT